MIAVFCRYEEDFRQLQATPKHMFIRIRSFHDIYPYKFTGIIRVRDWFRGPKEITEAYDHLRSRQPEIFD